MRNRRKSSNVVRLRMNFSSLMSRRLSGRYNLTKGKDSCFDLLPYTITELVSHLKANFQPGMSMDNYGEWHIDHIKPISKFNIHSLDCDEFKECWDLSNLQPLWAIDNMKKSNKY